MKVNNFRRAKSVASERVGMSPLLFRDIKLSQLHEYQFFMIESYVDKYCSFSQLSATAYWLACWIAFRVLIMIASVHLSGHVVLPEQEDHRITGDISWKTRQLHGLRS